MVGTGEVVVFWENSKESSWIKFVLSHGPLMQQGQPRTS